MSSAKNYVIVFLAGTTLAGAGLAWRQYNELIVLRARALDQAAAPSTAHRQVETPATFATESPLHSAATDDAPPVAASAPGSASATTQPARFDRGRRGPNVMDDPEVQKLMAVQRKANLDARYAALFRMLKLPPDQLDKLKNLLVDHGNAMSDVMAAARGQDGQRGNPAMLQKLVAEAQAEINAAIRETLGEVGYAQFRDYERTLPQRTVAQQLEQRLSYSSTPLSADQSAQLVQILSASSAALNANPATRATPFPVSITDTAINQALGVLAAPQIEALRELQREQQLQAELGAAMRSRFQRTQPAPPTATTPIAPITPALPAGQTSGD